MKLYCLACDALARIVYFCASQSPHIVNVNLMELGLHCTPNVLRSQLQERIDAVNADEYDAVVMGYGLCGKATVGLQATTLPIVSPRAHDCITLFLGSRERFRDQFEQQGGTYWYTKDFIERADCSGNALALGVDTGVNIHEVYDEYVEKYGKDNADYLMEAMGAWQDHINAQLLSISALATEAMSRSWLKKTPKSEAGPLSALPEILYSFAVYSTAIGNTIFSPLNRVKPWR